MTKSVQKPKYSEMLLEVADGYIQMGKTVADRANLLRSAITAWNIGCQPESSREESIQSYLIQYKLSNPKNSKSDNASFEDNIRKLVAQKERLYPNVTKQILGSKIDCINGKDYIAVQFTRD